jgi:hypothetical protein
VIQYAAASRFYRGTLEYWIARSSRAMTAADDDGSAYAAGTGSAVTDLIFSIAKREVTFFSGTALISFL